MTAHKFIEDSSIFEDVENLTVEVVPINIAHEAVRIAKKEAHNEAYQDVLTLLKERKNALQYVADDSYFLMSDLVDMIEKKIK